MNALAVVYNSFTAPERSQQTLLCVEESEEVVNGFTTA